jgi:hypothetical protein
MKHRPFWIRSYPQARVRCLYQIQTLASNEFRPQQNIVSAPQSYFLKVIFILTT